MTYLILYRCYSVSKKTQVVSITLKTEKVYLNDLFYILMILEKYTYLDYT